MDVGVSTLLSSAALAGEGAYNVECCFHSAKGINRRIFLAMNAIQMCVCAHTHIHVHVHASIHTHTCTAYLSSDGSANNRELFVSISSAKDPHTHHGLLQAHNYGGDFDSASIRVVVQPPSDSVLEQGSKTGAARTLVFDSDSFESDADFPKGEPLPFSGKRSMFSTGRVVDKVYLCIAFSDQTCMHACN